MADKSTDIKNKNAKDLSAEVPMEIVVGEDTTMEVVQQEEAAPAKKSKKEATHTQKTEEEARTSVLGNKTIEDVIQREAVEEQDTTHTFSLSRTLGGVIIARMFQRQIGLVLLICAFLIIYITNRYICQKKTVEIAKIEAKVVEARYKATVCTSILTEKSRESNIMQLLNAYGDSTLTIPKDPPYLIKVKDE